MGQVPVPVSRTHHIQQVSFRKAIDRLGGPIDIVKLDCEFAEWDLFKDQKAWQSVKYLTMEYHLWPGYSTAQNVKDMCNKINELGFTKVKVKPVNKNSGYLFVEGNLDK